MQGDVTSCILYLHIEVEYTVNLTVNFAMQSSKILKNILCRRQLKGTLYLVRLLYIR